MKIRHMLAVFVLCSLAITAAYAKEGSDSYPNGAENWQAGNVPGPGFYYLNYFVYYSGDLKNGSGDKVSLAGSTPSVTAEANAFRFLYVPNFKLLGGTYVVHLIVPVVHQNVNMGGEKSITGTGDFSIVPFAVSWHGKVIHQYAGLDIQAPTGHFNANDPRVSIGSGTWTETPIYGVSYLPSSGWELSGKFMYDFHQKNGSDNYKSGQDLHVDYLAGKHFGSLGLAAAGYVVKQFTDDTLNGATVAAVPGLYSTGRRGQVLSIGPSAMYVNKKHIIFAAQYMHETLTENRFGGDKFLVRLIVPTSSLWKKSK